MSYDLRDKTVFITGASTGIGRACGVEYHRTGANVVAVARSRDKLDDLARELGNNRIEPIVADITETEGRIAAVARARARFGRIDVLVNNAGWASFASVLRTPLDHVERMLGLNFVAPVAMIQLVLPELLDRRTGQIVNISSVVGAQPMPRMAAYAATKAALHALTSALRMELVGTGVDVILVAPGSTATSFFQTAAKLDTHPVRPERSQGTPQRVARAIVRASRSQKREVTLSTGGKLITVVRRFSHRLADAIMCEVGKRSMPAREPN